MPGWRLNKSRPQKVIMEGAANGARQAGDRTGPSAVSTLPNGEIPTPTPPGRSRGPGLGRARVLRPPHGSGWLPPGTAGAVHKWGETVFGPLRARWRRSLQLRVVGTTLVASAVVIAVLGFFLMQQIASGLLQNTERQATAQTLAGMNQALSQQGITDRPGTQDAVDAITHPIGQELQAGGSTTGASCAEYCVTFVVSAKRVPVAQPGWSNVSFSSLPAALVNDVTNAQDRGDDTLPFEGPTRIVYPNATQGPAALAVGVPVGPYYQLYYVFPLTKDLSVLQLIQHTLIVVGVALVLLLALIASLVTRWVVIPVRQAASAAKRVSDGDLDERMPVRGSDDLAALSSSFNEMAAGLQDKLQELEDLSQVQRQFVSDVSHELRTPLTTIRIAADVLYAARQQLDSAASRSAELLQSQLERFEVLLADLLEISRHDANAATLDAEPVDICDLVRGAADDAQQLAERRGSRIEFRLPAHQCVAEADRRRVERILRNLLVNAVEHGEGRGAVVTVAADRDAVAVAVRDFGVGLKPGEELLVFDRFWRADPARARTTGGTGLGLSIAQEDARLHGGWLEAWGEPGRGSVFRLTLPRVAGARLEGSPLPLAPGAGELASGREGLAAGLPLTAARTAQIIVRGGGRAEDG
jgi:two-component system, OmpR family, sensor histidine kinase MtrB